MHTSTNQGDRHWNRPHCHTSIIQYSSVRRSARSGDRGPGHSPPPTGATAYRAYGLIGVSQPHSINFHKIPTVACGWLSIFNLSVPTILLSKLFAALHVFRNYIFMGAKKNSILTTDKKFKNLPCAFKKRFIFYYKYFVENQVEVHTVCSLVLTIIIVTVSYTLNIEYGFVNKSIFIEYK